MGNRPGFTLLEVVVVLSLSTLLCLTFFHSLSHFQRWENRFHQRLLRDENLRLAPLLFSRLVSTAGNNRWQAHWTGLQIEGESLLVKSDVDGETGFPDLSLDHPFEDLGFRHREDEIQLKSGAGSFQPLLKNIQAMDAIRPETNLLTVKISTVPEEGSFGDPSEEISLDFFLWNWRDNLFPEAP